jgi:hypothetical protein
MSGLLRPSLGQNMGSPFTPYSSLLASLAEYPVTPPSPYSNALLGLLGAPPRSPAPSLLSQSPQAALRWAHVRGRFRAFIDNLAITPGQLEDGTRKQAGVRACLNRHYYGISSETANSRLIGSWGKLTRVSPSRDVDILFLLPDAVYWRYQNRGGNRQSDLLQEVKNVLRSTYSLTSMRGDPRTCCSLPMRQQPI